METPLEKWAIDEGRAYCSFYHNHSPLDQSIHLYCCEISSELFSTLMWVIASSSTTHCTSGPGKKWKWNATIGFKSHLVTNTESTLGTVFVSTDMTQWEWLEHKVSVWKLGTSETLTEDCDFCVKVTIASQLSTAIKFTSDSDWMDRFTILDEKYPKYSESAWKECNAVPGVDIHVTEISVKER